MKNIALLLFSLGIILVVYFPSLFIFFAQDDFILINHFSANNFPQNLVNVFGMPSVTHWRPVHNLYFLISGTVFLKNYFLYHLLTFLFQALIGVFIFKVVRTITKKDKVAFVSSFLYLVNSSHFISLTWISGSAVLIGTLLFLVSFWLFLKNKKILSTVLLLTSYLASEAMVFSFLIICFWILLNKKVLINLKYIFINLFLIIFFLVIRFLYLTPKLSSDSYQIVFSPEIFNSLKYYLLRIGGLGEGPEVKFWNLLILGLFLPIILFIWKKKILFSSEKNIVLALFIILAGLFPFVLIPNHLSAHYMSISIFGFGFLVALLVSKIPKVILLIFLVLYSISSFFIVTSGYKKSWVAVRANIAKGYILNIEKNNYKKGAVIKFGNTNLSDSKEAYVSLGTGEALSFWFKDKNYKACFEFINDCKEI